MIADDRLAHDLATEAGESLLELRRRRGFGDAAALRAAGDRSSHDFLTAALASRRPDDAVLSEEGKDDPARLAATRVWILDPLDGTREFGEEGRTDWAVHVALWQRTSGGDGRLAAGAVALPAHGQTFSTLPGHVGANRAGSNTDADVPHGLGATPAQPFGTIPRGTTASTGKLRVVVSRTRPPEFVRKLAAETGAELVPLGSAGAKIVLVLTGGVDAYIHAGGQHEWDSAAPVAVVQAAGLHASRIDGRPLAYNQPDPRLPDILVCRPGIAGQLLAEIRAIRVREG